VIKQIENILTYPNIKKKFENGNISIHGWYYHIETGNIEYYNADSYKFLPLNDLLENHL
jgi:carbonic anhydrase